MAVVSVCQEIERDYKTDPRLAVTYSQWVKGAMTVYVSYRVFKCKSKDATRAWEARQKASREMKSRSLELEKIPTQASPNRSLKFASSQSAILTEHELGKGPCEAQLQAQVSKLAHQQEVDRAEMRSFFHHLSPSNQRNSKDA
jgi:hypothetical protein